MQETIEGYAREFGLDFFPILYEVLDYKTMNEVAAYGGFPTRYPHWRFGMDYEQLAKGYEWGLQKIYEMVINTNPAYAYLLEGNSLVDQKTVMAHVCAHVDFFKHNYYFSKTNRKMIDGMANHAALVRRHMERHGQDVGRGLHRHLPVAREPDRSDVAVHPAAARGQGRRRRPTTTCRGCAPSSTWTSSSTRPSTSRRSARRRRRRRSRSGASPRSRSATSCVPDPHAPLQPWQRDVLEVVRDEAYYFAPQAMTKIMNEGWATYWHSKIMTEKAASTAEIIDYADACSGILATAPGRLNPYKLGVELFRHIEQRWNKGQFGKEWDECDSARRQARLGSAAGPGPAKIFEVRRLHNDITFLDEFFTFDFCVEQKFYSFGWNDKGRPGRSRPRVRQGQGAALALLTNRGQPFIYVEDGNHDNRAELLLRHRHDGVDLDMGQAKDTLQGAGQGVDPAGQPADQGRRQGQADPLRRRRAVGEGRGVPLTMRLLAWAKTDTGKKRDHNEDSFLVAEDIGPVRRGRRHGRATRAASTRRSWRSRCCTRRWPRPAATWWRRPRPSSRSGASRSSSG
jgi:stage V sporulation protein R